MSRTVYGEYTLLPDQYPRKGRPAAGPISTSKNNDDDDDTKFVKSRLAAFSRGELTVRMNLLGACIARDRPDSSYLEVLKA